MSNYELKQKYLKMSGNVKINNDDYIKWLEDIIISEKKIICQEKEYDYNSSEFNNILSNKIDFLCEEGILKRNYNI